jgi:hypothetical protein
MEIESQRQLLSKQTTLAPNHPAKEALMAWNVEGTYIEACNCEAACPCIFFSPPTEGECKVIIGGTLTRAVMVTPLSTV